ncbi:sulfotransferase [Kibdelosporangium philippinense]|uniref:Sulfotransferase n=1 Tax=Kibdelosporangium philippinense TaxID=211113 RepID=A0ABS8Z5A6_9PSEU|nr:sulfotransferase [Kibdelosporangium philippinense]MCE7003030.1 sulfotransferase [Kibdelosporangium philippinense]
MKPIVLWAVPRSRSTAFLRIMLERGDLEVAHEPFSYLQVDGHFTLAGRHATSPIELLDAILDVNANERRVFVKDTSDYKYTSLLSDKRLFTEVINTFMIREPHGAISSHYAMNASATMDEYGFEYLHDIFSAVRSVTGEVPVVIDGDDLVANPEATVKAYCERVGLSFKPEAMHWNPGEQTNWHRTNQWHAEVAGSSGLVAQAPKERATPDNNEHLRRVAAHHQPFYDALARHRLS